MKTVRIIALRTIRLDQLRDMDEELLIATAKDEPLAVLMPHKKFMKLLDDFRRAEEQLRNLSSGHLKEILQEPKN